MPVNPPKPDATFSCGRPPPQQLRVIIIIIIIIIITVVIIIIITNFIMTTIVITMTTIIINPIPNIIIIVVIPTTIVITIVIVIISRPRTGRQRDRGGIRVVVCDPSVHQRPDVPGIGGEKALVAEVSPEVIGHDLSVGVHLDPVQLLWRRLRASTKAGNHSR